EQVVLELDINSGNCSLVSRTKNELVDEFSPLRGGTPPLFDEELQEYVTLYHICYPGRASYTSLPKRVYISGACTFTAAPPFTLTGRSTGPFYQEELYGSNRTKVIFPTALVRKGDSYIVFYGEDDSKIKVAKIPREKMFNRMRRSNERDRKISSREN
ncbi:hypothetical protein K0U07_02035, partial [bacterium]|nr:hypothetical protein [bacterium]